MALALGPCSPSDTETTPRDMGAPKDGVRWLKIAKKEKEEMHDDENKT